MFETPPPFGTDEQSRYLKLRTMDEVMKPEVLNWIEQSRYLEGWK